jgi:hypothetical protein
MEGGLVSIGLRVGSDEACYEIVGGDIVGSKSKCSKFDFRESCNRIYSFQVARVKRIIFFRELPHLDILRGNHFLPSRNYPDCDSQGIHK